MRAMMCLVLFCFAMSYRPQAAGTLLESVDHIVYAAPDLQAGIDAVDRLLGVRATPGGSHPGRGTRNALVALGPASYIEIIGPDPDQPPPANGRPFGIDTLKAPKLVRWAMKGKDLDRIVTDARGRGVMLGAVAAGSRARPDGVLLKWRYTDPQTVVADGIVPFVIDWGATPHPAATAAPGARLVGLRAEHPDAARVQRMLAALGVDLQVERGAQPALVAMIDSPKGRVDLR